MELVYLWVEEYKNIRNQGFNFSPRFKCEFDGENLTITENKDYVSIFPENINVTAIVGENGSGKSSIFEFLINELTKQKSYVCVVFNKRKKKLRFSTNNKDIYKKNQKYGYIRIKYVRKYFGYVNLSPHENTMKNHKINTYFGMVSDKFKPTDFNNFLEGEKKDLNNSQDVKFEFLLKQIKEFIFMQYPDNYTYSSGEKAIIYYLGCIHYLLDKGLNLIIYIDEIELFLHPMWQKRAIKIFIESLKNKITRNMHIVITSHSPFILSDLPKENVIFLEKYKENEDEVKNKNQKEGNCKNVTKDIELKTFGANIHTLLSHGFFMSDGLMGEFAKSKIEEIKKFYDDNKNLKKDDSTFESKKEEFLKNKDRFENIQKIIGEKFLQTIIKNYLDELEILFNGKKEFLDKEIKRLEELRNELK